jgi:hypothetical protein
MGGLLGPQHPAGTCEASHRCPIREDVIGSGVLSICTAPAADAILTVGT